ncbi:MAG: cellulase family glycosylhydrolase, partial [Fimbriimonadaceae bacterium]|nr:cellulase family glycosylhydrolase [Fimbriimonadaceae bacterium]
MLTPILTLAVVGSTAPWFGPVDVSFRAEFPGNPQDGEANRVDLVFRPERGRETIVPAWERNGVWSGTFLTRTPGRYTVTLRRNGRAVTLPPKTVDVRRRSDVAFVRRSGAGFRLDGGAAYWPIGHNLGWNSSTHTVERQLGEMGRNGLNWARIWACHWDGKNPFFGAPAGPAAAGLMNQTVLDRWDRITEAAEKAGVRFQLVLFHHGLFSTSTNPNWQEHPWNTANGGFLQNPADFFTDPTAKRLSRNWLRYAVARYGSSPSIMSWELFNEVEWVDAIRNGRSADVGRWHDEMADYIRSIDPYRLLVTTSSETHLPIYRKADFLQPHSYVQNLETRIAAEPQPKGRPVFFGEVGRATHEGPDIREQEKTIPREAAWAAAFAGHGGAAQYWFWDRVTAYDMYPEYRRQTEVLRRSGFMAQAPGRPERAKVEGPRGGDLVGSPGQGWGATRATEIDLDADPQGT